MLLVTILAQHLYRTTMVLHIKVAVRTDARRVVILPGGERPIHMGLSCETKASHNIILYITPA